MSEVNEHEVEKNVSEAFTTQMILGTFQSLSPKEVLPTRASLVAMVDKLRGFLTRHVLSLSPKEFLNGTIEVSWKLKCPEKTATDTTTWEQESPYVFTIPRSDFKYISHYDKMISDLLSYKEDIVRDSVFHKNGKKELVWGVVIGYDISEDSDEDDSDDEDEESEEED